MPLTPEDVRNKQFTTVRLREGYDEDEVDAFLDEVEAELTRLLRENEDLRAKLAAATRAAAQNQQNMRKPPEGQDQQHPQHQQQGMRGPGAPVPAGISGPIKQPNSRPLRWACSASNAVVSSTRVRKSKSIISMASLPASILEKSRMSLMTVRSASPD